MVKKDFAFGKINFILTGVALALIIIGFALMSGGGSTDGVTFNPEIFNARRISVAPLVTLLGYLMMVVAIVAPDKKKEQDNPSAKDEQ